MYRAVGVVRDAGHASENVVKGGILALRDGVDLLIVHRIGARPCIRADLKPALLELACRYYYWLLSRATGISRRRCRRGFARDGSGVAVGGLGNARCVCLRWAI